MAFAFPPAFAARMKRLLGEASFAAFAAAYDRPYRRGVRANTLKIAPSDLAAQLPVAVTPCAFSPVGYSTEETWKAGADPLHHAGAYYVQEPSAMSAVTVLAPVPGETVLDLCAAPGGKSTQIAAALQGEGLLWSNEFVRSRATALAQNMERCGVRNAVVSCMDTAPLCEALADRFHAVLADVPCSGEGMFRKEAAALADWSEAAIAHCVERGRHILNAAAKAVMPGGRLLYSTCTFAPEENECQIAWFLNTHPSFELVPIEGSFGRPAFAWQHVATFAPDCAAPAADLTRARRILPPEGEGHFLALLRRKEDAPVVSRNRPGYKAPNKRLQEQALALYTACFTDTPSGVFTAVGDTVRLLPETFPETEKLHLIAAGVAVAVRRGERLEPAHGAFMAARPSQCRLCLELAPSDPLLATFLRGEEIPVPEHWKGYCAVAVAGAVTGFGKAVNGRLKNHYPKGLRRYS